MAKGENQKQKLLYLLKIFMEETDSGHGLSMPDIIDLLGEYQVNAERKSVYDDINTLNDFGYDIRGEKVGKSFVYYMASRDFELPELKLLVDAVQSSKFVTQSKSNSLIKKLENLASVYEGKELHRQVYVANRTKTANEAIFYNVDYIQNAIAENKKIQFKYFQWNQRKEQELRHDGKSYLISPWALTWDDENYYMVGYDSEDGKIKHYRVDKMLKISVSDEKREGKELFKQFDMAVYSKKVFGMYGGKEETVSLLCDNSMAGVIIDRFGKDVAMRESDENHFIARVNVAISPQFFGWVCSLGGLVSIAAPENVVEAMKEELRKQINLYK